MSPRSAFDQAKSPRALDDRVVSQDTIARRLTLAPGMCGHNSLLVGTGGDWTWDAARRLCNVNPYLARNARGEPTYLSFCYYHVKGGSDADLKSFTIGDEVEVLTRCYQSGLSGLHTVHRLRRVVPQTPSEAMPLHVEDVYETPDDNCLYLQTYNRWVGRANGSSNEKLVKAVPPEFCTRHLPKLPRDYAPRNFYQRAIVEETFFTPIPPGYSIVSGASPVETTYAINLARDINGVGLLYFASYFTIVDETLLRVWRSRGGSPEHFLRRQVREQKIVFLGNADYQTSLNLRSQLWFKPPSDYAFNTVVARGSDSKVIAVCTLWLRAKCALREPRLGTGSQRG